MRLILAMLLFPASVRAAQLINGNQINPNSDISINKMSVTGPSGLAVTYGVTAASVTVPGTTLTSTTSIFMRGNVGIGTASPAASLDVAGTGIKTSSFTVGGYDVLGAWYGFTPSVSGSGSMSVSVGAATQAKYQIIGKTMCLAIYLASITIGGTPSTTVFMVLPGGKSADGTSSYAARVLDAGANTTEYFGTQNTNTVFWERNNGANWTAAANARVSFNGCIPIQ